MKKICTLAFAVLFGLNAMAQQKSNVVVFSEDGESFFAFLNGIKQNATAQSNVKITDIPGEGASLRLVFANSSDQPIKQDLYFMEPNQEHTIKVKRDKKGVLKMRYFGAVPLAQSAPVAATVPYTVTEPVASTPVYTNTTGTADNSSTVNTTNTYNTSTSTTGETGSVNMNMQVNDPNMNGTTTSHTTTTTTTTTNAGTTGTGTTGNGSVNMNVGVSENGFNMNVSVSGDGDLGNEKVNMNMGMSGMEGTTTSSTTTTTTTTTSSSSTVNGHTTSSSSSTTTNGGYATSGYDNAAYTTSGNTGYAAAGSCGFAMDDMSFQKMKNTISSNSFDDTKMSTAKTATKGSCLSTDQVKEIMQLFSFDDDRLAYAKFAYDYTVDKNNYYTLGTSFTYDGNKEELNQFIETKR